jgi:hypothetical protein
MIDFSKKSWFGNSSWNDMIEFFWYEYDIWNTGSNNTTGVVKISDKTGKINPDRKSYHSTL